MTRAVGRSLPHLGASLLIHAALLLGLTLALARASAPEVPPAPPAVVLLTAFRPPAPFARPATAAADRGAVQPERLRPAERPVAREVPLPAAFSDLPGPSLMTAVARPAPAAALDPVRAGGGERPARLEAPREFPAPDFAAALAPPAGPAAVPADDPVAAAVVAEEQPIDWSGRPRRILVRRTPQFPPKLAREGLEAEVTARISVSPDGQVTSVEIVRSCGYTLGDLEVVQALREWLFEKSSSGKPDTGTIPFRFRLER